MLTHSASVMIWISDANKECVYFNESWLTFTGKRLNDEAGFGWSKGVHPDDYGRCREIFGQAFDQRQSFSMDYRLLRADGVYRWIRDEGAPYFEPTGEFVGYIGSCHDIHEQTSALKQLAESKKRISEERQEYSSTLDSLQIGIVLHAEDTSILYSNRAATDILGLTQEQMAGKKAIDPAWQFIDEQLNPLPLSRYPVNVALSSSANLFDYVVGVLRPDRDKPIWASVTTHYLETQNPDDSVQGKAIISFVDITARKEAENQLTRSEALLSSHVENTPLGCITWDPNLICTSWNPAATSIFGYSESEMIGLSSWESIVPEEVKGHVFNLFHSLLHRTGGESSINQNRTKDGKVIVCEWFNTTLVDKEGRVLGIASMVSDVTEKKEKESLLLTQSQITSNMIEGVCLVVSDSQKIVYVNPTFEKMFRCHQDSVVGKKLTELDCFGIQLDSDTIKEVVQSVANKKVWRREWSRSNEQGENVWYSTSLSGFDHPTHGPVWIVVTADVTDKKLLDYKLAYSASHDSLTGLINRSEFELRANQLMTDVEGSQRQHALCFLDLDQFKVINDTCGHTAGDELLRQLAIELDTLVRKNDTLARLGGDEFAILLEDCSLEQAFRVAQSVLSQIADYQFVWESGVFRIGASIGLVEINAATGNLTTLLKQADIACYTAKEQGRNRIHVFKEDDAEINLRKGQIEWISKIEAALTDNRFILFAQPIQSFKKPGAGHYEILIRLRGEDGQIYPPGAFLPAAERYDIIGRIDHWVVTEVADLFVRYREFFQSVDLVAINLSGASLGDFHFLEYILELVRSGSLAPDKVCFEVTETVVISNLKSAVKFINSLRSLGFSFALDDFGSGISSFGYLKNLPVDYLKIDGMFVKDIAEDSFDYAMVKSINDLGQLMGMTTVAEFVESDAIISKLREIGVDYGQGFALGKPESFIDLIKSST
ncbi:MULTISPECIES: PAS domain-containing protein [Marinobacter]|nr:MULTISPECIES: PAS domain-containing protein [Marinobacter]MBO6812092.1 EAL domain-containing protein [Marinobacter sp.]MBO6873660.1 EAL domain-containing protein [Marinobacter sp.]